MIRWNSEADSIVWMVEGEQDFVVSVWIRTPKTILVFGFFLKRFRGRFRLDLIPRPVVDSTRRIFCYAEKTS